MHCKPLDICECKEWRDWAACHSFLYAFHGQMFKSKTFSYIFSEATGPVKVVSKP